VRVVVDIGEEVQLRLAQVVNRGEEAPVTRFRPEPVEGTAEAVAIARLDRSHRNRPSISQMDGLFHTPDAMS
jgi:hypothetical protein